MNKLIAMTITSAAVAVVSLATSAYTTIRGHLALKRLNKAVGDVEEMSTEKITDDLIRKAVEVSANRQVEKYMQETEDRVLRIAHSDLETAARNAVERYSSDIRKKAAEEVSHQVANMDIEKLQKRVCDQAERHVMEKLDGCLDEYAQKFEEQLDNSRKIYDRIARAALEKERDDKDGIHVVLI